MPYLLAGALGGLLSFVLSVPAIIEELFFKGRIKNTPLVVEIKMEGDPERIGPLPFLLGLVIHLVAAFIFAVGYVFAFHLLSVTNILPAYTIVSFIVYALSVWLLVNLIVFPLTGQGFFGRKEGAFVWLELLITMMLVSVGLFFVMRFYPSLFFLA